jgi:hypothetical protein
MWTSGQVSFRSVKVICADRLRMSEVILLSLYIQDLHGVDGENFNVYFKF